MKHCPKCSRTYSDDSLSFCLDDGALLSRGKANPLDTNATLPYASANVTSAPPATEIIPPAAAPTLAAIPLKEQLRRANTTATRSSNSILTAAVITIALLLLVIAGLGIVFLLRQKSAEQEVVQPAGNKNTAPASATASRDPSVARNSQTGTEEDVQQPKSPLKIKVTASSVRLAVQSNTYAPENVMDGTRRTAWIEGVDGPGVGEWLRFDFDREINLHRILILPGYFKSPEIWGRNNRVSAATFNFSDGSSRLFNFPDVMERQSLDVGSVRTNWVRVTIDNVYSGTDPDTAISEIAFEWEP